MNAYNVTIPKALSRMGDLVLVPRKEYESFLVFRSFQEFTPTALQKKKLKIARSNRKKGNYLTLNELKNKLGFTS